MEAKQIEEIFENIDEKAEKEETQFFLAEDSKGVKIVGAIKAEEEYYFNSKYDSGEMVEFWCNQHSVTNYNTIALVFGMGNGEYIRALRKENEKMFIFVYEPSYSIAKINYDYMEAGDLLTDSRIYLSVGKENVETINKLLNQLIVYENVKYFKFFVTPNYENVFPEDYNTIKDIYMNIIISEQCNRNTAILMNSDMKKNIVGNIIDCIKGYSLYDLIESFKEISIENIPAVIVSAGPSLDKNIKDLKLIDKNAFVIAVDTALNPLGKEKIIPDIAVTIDPKKPVSLFTNELMKHVPLVCSLSTNSDIKKVLKGMRIYQNNYTTVLDIYYSKNKKKVAALGTGGSVANDAFSLAFVLGFKTIILVGQDLAYPDNKEHAEDSFGTLQSNDVTTKNKYLFEVEDIYGGKVKTEPNMDKYRKWFEHEIAIHQEIRVIDATEGGAKIKGTEIMTLKEALTRECKAENKIDFLRIISGIPTAFTEKEQKDILEDLSKYDTRLEKIREYIKELKKAYEKLDEFNRKQKYTGKEFNDLVRKITILNEWFNNDAEVAYLNLYVEDSNYQLKDAITEERENMYEEIKLVVDSGLKMMDALWEATYQVEKDMKIVQNEAGKNIT
ncbi:MAG: motility associated factor glycosyltransferase family protein [Lachnospiraceae bacterium]